MDDNKNMSNVQLNMDDNKNSSNVQNRFFFSFSFLFFFLFSFLFFGKKYTEKQKIV